MKKILKMKAKGFTLVEIIVVLVILAAMAALLVPSIVGYIDKANDNVILQEAGSAVKACQTLASEKYAKDRTFMSFTNGDYTAAAALAEIKGTISDVTVGSTGAVKGKITALTYTVTASAKKVTYTNTDGLSPAYTVSDVTP